MCITKITQNISYNTCATTRALGGLETKAVLINRNEIDLTALTTSGASVTNLSLTSGATGYSIDWIKQLGNTASEFAVNENGLNGFNQSFVCRVFTQTAADFERIAELGNGEFVIVVEKKFKGENKLSAFSVFGLENGLSMSEGNKSSIENDGAFIFTLASQEGYSEKYPEMIWSEGDYTTNKAKFDALFAE